MKRLKLLPCATRSSVVEPGSVGRALPGSALLAPAGTAGACWVLYSCSQAARLLLLFRSQPLAVYFAMPTPPDPCSPMQKGWII